MEIRSSSEADTRTAALKPCSYSTRRCLTPARGTRVNFSRRQVSRRFDGKVVLRPYICFASSHNRCCITRVRLRQIELAFTACFWVFPSSVARLPLFAFTLTCSPAPSCRTRNTVAPFSTCTHYLNRHFRHPSQDELETPTATDPFELTYAT